VSELPKVLLLGDSIRTSYQPLAAERLAGRARVVGPAENGQFALYTLASLSRWLGALGAPDAVHWNNGLHDVGHNPNRCPPQVPLDDYVGNLAHVLAALRATGAAVVWATTTPVAPDAPFHTDRWGWRNAEIDAYNAAARALMAAEGVPIDDLHAIVAADPAGLICEDELHLSPAGQDACADAVADAVRAVLPVCR